MLLLFAIFSLNAQEQFENILFASGQHSLASTSKTQLDDLVRSANQKFDYKITLHGHTDSDGDLAFNEQLAKQRCDAVKRYLVEQGLNPAKLNISASGEAKPVASNQNESGKALNRRVELAIQAWEVKSSEDMYSYFEESSAQKFVLPQPNASLEIKGDEGSTVRIPDNAFVYLDGSSLSANDQVEIELDEAIKPSSMIKYRLNTSDDKNRLATGGMIRLEATVNGRELKLAEGKQIEVSLPKVDDEAMNLYEGERKEDGTMAWNQVEQVIGENVPNTNTLPFLNMTEETRRPIDHFIFRGYRFAWDTQENAELKRLREKGHGILRALNIHVPAKPRPLSDRGMPELPDEPANPLDALKAPSKPKKARRKTARPPKSLIKRIAWNKEEAQQELDESYKVRKAAYEIKLTEYNEKLSTYNAEKERILAELKIQEQNVDSVLIAKRLNITEQYIKECIEYDAAVRMRANVTSNDRFAKNRFDDYIRGIDFRYILQAPTVMTLDIKRLRAEAKGEKLSRKDNYTNLYETKVKNRTHKYLGDHQEFAALKEAFSAELERVYNLRWAEKALDNEFSKAVVSTYDFQITPFTWWNCDRPLPPGKAMIAFMGTKESGVGENEIFAFNPASKTLNYLSNIFLSNWDRSRITTDPYTEIRYLSFDLDGDNSAMAYGKKMVRTGENKIRMKFYNVTVEDVEKAFAFFDAEMQGDIGYSSDE